MKIYCHIYQCPTNETKRRRRSDQIQRRIYVDFLYFFLFFRFALNSISAEFNNEIDLMENSVAFPHSHEIKGTDDFEFDFYLIARSHFCLWDGLHVHRIYRSNYVSITMQNDEIRNAHSTHSIKSSIVSSSSIVFLLPELICFSRHEFAAKLLNFQQTRETEKKTKIERKTNEKKVEKIRVTTTEWKE